VARSTKPSGPAEPARENTDESIEPSFETEWHATQRVFALVVEPLLSQGGLASVASSNGAGVPSTVFAPEPKTVSVVPLFRSILTICPSLMAQ
jgi:hypothetical protein